MVSAVIAKSTPGCGYAYIGALDLRLRDEPLPAWAARMGADACTVSGDSAYLYRRTEFERVSLPTFLTRPWVALCGLVQPMPPFLRRVIPAPISADDVRTGWQRTPWTKPAVVLRTGMFEMSWDSLDLCLELQEYVGWREAPG